MHHLKRATFPLALAAALGAAASGQTAQAAVGGGPEILLEGDVASTCILDAGFTRAPEYVFVETDATAYLKDNAVLKDVPYEDGGDVVNLEKYAEIRLTGMNDLTYQAVELNGETCYLDRSSFTLDKAEIDAMKAAEEEAARKEREAAEAAERERIAAEEAAAAQAAQAYYEPQAYQAEQPVYSQPSGNGVLTAAAGVNYGPSGKETYYNLDMSGVVANMQAAGNTGEYWVREDGVKMLGDYVIVAANLDTHPRGSLVETSLGTGIVADTGGFAYGNPNQVDIATAW